MSFSMFVLLCVCERIPLSLIGGLDEQGRLC